MTDISKTEEKQVNTKFTKAQIYSSEKFKADRDIVNAVLDDEKTYTLKEVNKCIDNYLSKKL